MENIVRKGEIAGNRQFLLFSQCFLLHMVFIFRFKCTLKCELFAICFNSDQPKILSSGNGLTHHHTIVILNYSEEDKYPFENTTAEVFSPFLTMFLADYITLATL